MTKRNTISDGHPSFPTVARKRRRIDPPQPQPLNADYTVGWICAIKSEFVAARVFLDEDHGSPKEVAQNDNNLYAIGKMGDLHVVIASLTRWEDRTISAATAARQVLHSFPSLRIGLMVGVGGGAPTPEHDIRLGDIVVGSRVGGKHSVVRYDYGKAMQNQSSVETGVLNQPPQTLLTAMNGLDADYNENGHQLGDSMEMALQNIKRRHAYTRPPADTDKLYRSSFVHPRNSNASCNGMCDEDPSNLSSRAERDEHKNNLKVHHGLVASANQFMKNAVVRDKLAAERGIMCFERQAADLMDHFPCLVVRGICDYSDSHNNKDWQGFAAMAAAAYAKDLLSHIPVRRVEAENRITDVVSAVTDVVREEFEPVSRLAMDQHDQEHQAILTWLTPTDYPLRHNDIISQRQEGTGNWLLDSTEFQAWLNGEKQTLFCPGIPGAGKTIMAAIVIDYLQSKFREDENTGIAYIYCDFSRSDEQTIENLLASLLKQLSLWRPDSVKSLYDRHEKRKTRPDLSEILRTLQSVATMYSRVFVVVDAVDEYQASDPDRVKLLKEILQLQDFTSANIFATSRPNREIALFFDGGLSRTISAVNDDILAYLDDQISRQQRIVIDENMRITVKTAVLEAADGMFLLAKLHMDTLLSKLTKGHLKQALRTLGKGMAGLESCYDQAVDRIECQEREQEHMAKQILIWITHAKRPLTMSELRHALAVEEGTIALNPDFLLDPDSIVSCCAGLVTVDKETDIVRLVHYTTREYFQKMQ
ncbi:hypothetical protein ACHAPU_007908 [Fusarium lateritium]